MKKIPTIFIRILLIFASLCIFFVLAEIATRLFYDESKNYGESEWFNAQLGIFAPWPIGISKEEQKNIYINKDNELYYSIDDNLLAEKVYGYSNSTESRVCLL